MNRGLASFIQRPPGAGYPAPPSPAGGGGGGGGGKVGDIFGGKTRLNAGSGFIRVATFDIGTDDATPMMVHAYGQVFHDQVDGSGNLVAHPSKYRGVELQCTWGRKQGNISQTFMANRRFCLVGTRVDVYARIINLLTGAQAPVATPNDYVDLSAFVVQGSDSGVEPPTTWAQYLDQGGGNGYVSQIASAPGTIFTLEGTNEDAPGGTIFIQLYDVTQDPSASGGTPVPVVAMQIATGLPFALRFGDGLTFQTGLWVMASTIAEASTAPALTSLNNFNAQTTTY